MLFSEEELDKIWNNEREFLKDFKQKETCLGLTPIDYSYMCEEKRAKLYFPIITQIQDSEKLLRLHNCATRAFGHINQASELGLKSPYSESFKELAEQTVKMVEKRMHDLNISVSSSEVKNTDETKPVGEHELIRAMSWLRRNNVVGEDSEELVPLAMIKGLSARGIEDMQKLGSAYELAFWLDFLLISNVSTFMMGEVLEIRLSRLLDMYLNTYREVIHVSHSERSKFFDLLKERYYEITRIFSEAEPGSVGLELLRFIRTWVKAEDFDLLLGTRGILDAIGVPNALADSVSKFRLIKDI
jgi:hypothetical protein